MVRALDLQLTVMSSNPCNFDFSRLRPAPSWILKNLHFQRSERSTVHNYVIMPNFVEIAGTKAEISHFLIFQNGGRRYLFF